MWGVLERRALGLALFFSIPWDRRMQNIDLDVDNILEGGYNLNCN